jgi:hypothetical protein
LLELHVQPLDDEFQAIEDFLSDENLRLAAGSHDADISKVRRLELKVDTTEMSMSSVGHRMPCLNEVKLNNSIIPSIRDLGTGFKNVRILWVSRCGLKDLEGIGAIGSITELYAAFNDIKELSPLNACDGIEVLDLEGNRVADADEVAFLSNCTTLNSLSLEGNPVTQQPQYRHSVAKLLPSLMSLDDKDLTDVQEPSIEHADVVSVPCTPEPELDMVHMGIKYARCGIDEANFCLHDVDEKEALEMTASVDRAVYTGGSNTTRTRPQSARVHRPSSATQRPGSANSRQRPHTASRSRSMASMSTSTEAEVTNPHSSADDTSSDLTFGLSEALAGNPVKALRSRQLAATAEGKVEVEFETEVLEQLKAWKLETATIAQRRDEQIEPEIGASEAAERLVFDVAAGDGSVATPRHPIFYTEGKQSVVDMAVELAQRTEYRPRTADRELLNPTEPSLSVDNGPILPAQPNGASPNGAISAPQGPLTKLRRTRTPQSLIEPVPLLTVPSERPKSAGRLRPKTPDRKSGLEYIPAVAQSGAPLAPTQLQQEHAAMERPKSAGKLRTKTPDRARTPPAKENDLNQVAFISSSPDDEAEQAVGTVITGRLRPKQVDRMKVVSMSSSLA